MQSHNRDLYFGNTFYKDKLNDESTKTAAIYRGRVLLISHPQIYWYLEVQRVKQ